MDPTIGRIVHYKLSSFDADEILNTRGQGSRRVNGAPGGLKGNAVAPGDVYPAMTVRVGSEGSPTCQLQVFLDGNDTHWATSRTQGDEEGQWSWPVITRPA